MRRVHWLCVLTGVLAVMGLLLIVIPRGQTVPEAAVADAASVHVTAQRYPAPPPAPGPQQFAGPPHAPTLAVVGASFSAGVGAGAPTHAWPADLGRLIGWRVVVSADPGAGFVSRGDRGLGPFDRLAGRLDLPALHPGLVIVQGGHDDIGLPLPLVSQRVRQLVDSIRQQAPDARIAVLSVFADAQGPTQASWRTDRTIVAAARAADPGVLVFDPLADHWRFPRVHDHLHPSPSGHQEIAQDLAAGLRHDGVVAGSSEAHLAVVRG